MSDLGSFFAKKDKKGKNKKKVMGPEELAKKMEQIQNDAAKELEAHGLDGGENPDAGDQAKSTPQPLILPASILKDDEEWNDFDEDKQPDITGLKIQNLNLVEKERIEEEEQESMQKAVEDAKSTMKWNIGNKQDGDSSDDEDNETAKTDEDKVEAKPAAPAEKKEEPEKAVPEKYVPPRLRNAQNVPNAANGFVPVLDKVSIKKGKTNQKIDVSSAEQFPSLGCATGSGGGKTSADSSFTSVKKGVRGADNSEGPTGGGLKTSNQFGLLKSSKN